MENIEGSAPTVQRQHLLTIEIVAIFVWIYVIVKLLIFDIDAYLLTKYVPNFLWVLDYKFFIIIGSISLYWLFVKNRQFWISIVLISLYPFFLIFWRAPKIFFKSRSWLGVFALLGIIISFFRSAKLNFITYTLVLIAFLSILSGQNHSLIYIAIIVLFLFLTLHFTRRFYFALNPMRNFSMKPETIQNTNNRIQELYPIPNKSESLENKEPSEEQAKDRMRNLYKILIMNRLYYFLIRKLQYFQNSKIIILYYALALTFSLLLTVIIFGFQYFALNKVDPNSFHNSNMDSLFYFIYYSLNTLFTNGISDFYPISGWARLLSSIEILFGFFLLVILFSLAFTVQREKHNEEIENLLSTFAFQEKHLAKFIGKEFKLSIDDALSEIKKLEGSLVKIAYYLSSS